MFSSIHDKIKSLEENQWLWMEDFSEKSPYIARAIGPVMIIETIALRIFASLTIGYVDMCRPSNGSNFEHARRFALKTGVLAWIPCGYYLIMRPALWALCNTVYSVFMLAMFEISPKKVSVDEANAFRENRFFKEYFFDLTVKHSRKAAFRHEIYALSKKLYQAKTDKEIRCFQFPSTPESKQVFCEKIKKKASLMNAMMNKSRDLFTGAAQGQQKEDQRVCTGFSELYTYMSEYSEKVFSEEDIQEEFDPYYVALPEEIEKNKLFTIMKVVLLNQKSFLRRSYGALIHSFIRDSRKYTQTT